MIPKTRNPIRKDVEDEDIEDWCETYFGHKDDEEGE